MRRPSTIQMTFYGLALLAFAIAQPGFQAFASVSVERAPWPRAIIDSVRDATSEPIGTLILLTPFALLALAAVSIAKRKSVGAAALLFGIAAAILGGMYLSAHIASARYIIEHKWTAASLAVGLLPFKGVPLVLALWLLTHRIAESRS
jgi:heme/copper-type cytochrome/quinol oxidase subunit 3